LVIVLTNLVFRVAVIFLALVVFAAPAGAQCAAAPPKQAAATRVANGAITLDGRLAESAWESAKAVSDFHGAADGNLLVREGLATFTIPDNDFNVYSFRSNVVLRWEYRPGSMLFLVWQQDRRRSETISDSIGFSDPFRSLAVPGTNAAVVKMSFWLPL